MHGLNELERHEGPPLQKRFSELILWERVKRRERILLSVFFYSVLASSIISLPLNGLFPSWFAPLSLLPMFFLFFATGIFLLHPWGSRDSLRTIFLLDKTLHLEERAITAWEILDRREKKGADLLVLEEAGEKLRGIEPRELFKRRLTWHALLAFPLLLLWLFLLWLDVGVHFGRDTEGSPPPLSVAHKLKEFVQDIKEKAKAERLAESLKIAQALEEVAERNLRGEMAEEELGENLAGMASKIDAMGPASEGPDLLFPKVATTREGILDLKAEMETLQHTLALPDSATPEGILGPEILGRLGALPRLRGEVEKSLSSIEKLGKEELHRFLNKLGRGVDAELDRHTLMEIREFLDSLLKGGEGRGSGEALRGAWRAEQRWLSQAERSRGKGSLPGDQPGTKAGQPQASPPFKAQAATHLKGLLGEGRSGSLILRGEPGGRESEVSQEEVLTSYQRQVEEELSSEQIPEGLKETVKRYFLSLGMTGDNK